MVIGFEPQPASLLRAAGNLAANGLEGRVRLVSVALGRDEGLLPLARPPAANAGTSNRFDAGPGVTVAVAPLRRLLADLGVPALRLFLLDVEGYEAPVLAGLGDVPVDLLVVEVEPLLLAKAGLTGDDLLDRIARLGFRLHTLAGEPVGPGAGRLPENNVVGVRPGVEPVWVTDRGRG